jgi:hypothetical protein
MNLPFLPHECIYSYIGCSYKFFPKASVEVDCELVRLHNKNINNAKNEVRLKQLIGDP